MSSHILVLLLQTVSSLGLLLLWLRFLLQLVRADFYNPLSQNVVQLTDVVLKPLRRIIPASRHYDFAALVAIVLLELLSLTLLSLIITGMTVAPLLLVLQTVFSLTWQLTQFFQWAIIIRVLASWVFPGYSPFTSMLAQLVEPVLVPFRRLLPPMGMMDFAPLLALLAVQVSQIVLARFGGAYIVAM